MKKSVFVIGFLLPLFSFCCYAQQKMAVREIYYHVDENGNINERKILGERNLTFTRGRGLTQVSYHSGFRFGRANREVDIYNVDYISRKSGESTRVFDDRARLVECTVDSVTYSFSYNRYDDPVEIRWKYNREDRLSTVTFDYFYFCDVDCLKPKDKERDRYYRLGITPSGQGCPWMLRTIKKDGVTVQYAERKYKN